MSPDIKLDHPVPPSGQRFILTRLIRIEDPPADDRRELISMLMISFAVLFSAGVVAGYFIAKVEQKELKR